MAIRDLSRKPYIIDNDENKFVGIDLPFRKSEGKEGYFASTSTTLEAVKNNIRNLLNTNQGERLMQPLLGIDLKKYLFNQINEETVLSIQDEIITTFEFWLPFVQIRDIQVSQNNNDSVHSDNSIFINIIFNIVQDPNTLESVQVSISSNINENKTNPIGY